MTPAILAAAAAIAFAPAAAADDDDDLSPGPSPRGSSQQEKSKSDVPQGWTNEALWARDTPGGSNQFGTLPKPPIYALD